MPLVNSCRRPFILTIFSTCTVHPSLHSFYLPSSHYFPSIFHPSFSPLLVQASFYFPLLSLHLSSCKTRIDSSKSPSLFSMLLERGHDLSLNSKCLNLPVSLRVGPLQISRFHSLVPPSSNCLVFCAQRGMQKVNNV